MAESLTSASLPTVPKSCSLGAMRVLVVGLGGLGAPALGVLVKSGARRFTLLDDDVVEASNLHRQTLYEAADVGLAKTTAAQRRLLALAAGASLELALREERLHPGNALELVRGHDLVLEGADNFATKFLAADAARLAGVPIVQAGAVRWSGWALASAAHLGPCLRCVFEDIPRGQPDTCASAGVVGPVVAAMAAVEAALALQLLSGEERAAGVLFNYDALRGRLSKRRVARRAGCPLCERRITDLSLDRYVNPCNA